MLLQIVATALLAGLALIGVYVTTAVLIYAHGRFADRREALKQARRINRVKLGR